MSPILFILASEALSRGLKKHVSEGSIIPSALPRESLTITHLSFADDVVIFTREIEDQLGI